MSYHQVQYPSLVEPLEPSLIVAQNLGWLRDTEQPPAGIEPLVSTGYYVTDIVLLETITFDKWAQQTNQPYLEIEYPNQEQTWGGIHEVTLYVPQNLDWLQQTNQPYLEIEPVEPGERTFIGAAAFTVEDVTLDKWFRPTETPPDTLEPINYGQVWTGILEPTLHVIQNLDWVPRTVDNPDDIEYPVDEGLWVGILNPDLYPLVFADLDKWWQPTSQPLFDVEPTYTLPQGVSEEPVLVVFWSKITGKFPIHGYAIRKLVASLWTTGATVYVRLRDDTGGGYHGEVPCSSATETVVESGSFTVTRGNTFYVEGGSLDGNDGRIDWIGIPPAF